ncbi:ABC transporter substrate-binding protein [Pelomonas aquatica]|jgi:peptide/nickel transport system substrate-binding protein|uniref:ABC transporter substrate-binding protein n=1 Tax=Pelomonas aquatica TaxID=431058 RepID=A0A9X4R2T9_9BURK|nr:ABC transporter substrate-binding protein [Pelomonas aquatica]MCY4753231.1 ABC transporter substrate-binding protein [Pelomonas aquatica]MDG0861312.1 ABC transporter substrate-binding protein [Pelomonas aquatica]
MKRWLGMALLAWACGASAQTLRWAGAGDPQTLDPHSQNESLTNVVNGQIYERLTNRDAKLALVPGLATSWSQTGPLSWRFKLRPGVKFHDGTPLTADDVVFSVQRAKEPTSQIANYANAVGVARRADDLTVDFQLSSFNPVFLQHIDQLWIMSRKWCEAHRAVKPLDFKNKEEGYAALNANGTGPFMLASRQPGIRTVLRRNPNWWNKFEGNVQELVFTPIASDATRLAALVSGEVDFVHDPAPRDVARLRNTAGVKIIDGPENRLVFIGMDQARDRLLYGNVPGNRNPFKDQRVRRALYQAIDIEALRSKLMRGLSTPTGGLTPSANASFDDPALQTRLPYDLAAARRLMAEAGFADGFEVTLDCPNNRYINDEQICIALAAMWAQLKVKVKVNAMPRALYFPKLEKLDTSLYMYGWGGSVTDAETALTPLYRNRGEKGVGDYNYGDFRNDRADALAAQSSVEPDPKKRETQIRGALAALREQVNVIPLHRQVIPWAAQANVTPVHRPDNWLELAWVQIGR